MDLTATIEVLKKQREDIDRAIEVLQRLNATVGSAGSGGGVEERAVGIGRVLAATEPTPPSRRPQFSQLKQTTPKRRGRPPMSAAARKRISDAMKKRWKTSKKAGKTTLATKRKYTRRSQQQPQSAEGMSTIQAAAEGMRESA